MMIYRNGSSLHLLNPEDGYTDFNPGGESVRCGNKKTHGDYAVYHANAAAVRSCFLGDGVCDWLMDMGTHPEDGERMIMECGYALHVTARGHHCDNGHQHVTAEVRWTEGWDYASDELEAEGLRKCGVEAVAMNGGSI